MKKLFLLFYLFVFLLSKAVTYGAPPSAPTITSISPLSGSVGTTVTLTGSGYAASGNIVYVGGVKATIISESTSSISFKVPCGSEYEYVVVINPTSGLSVKSNQKFKTLFPFPALSATNFKSPVDIVATSGSTGFQSELADLNNDGYLDLITSQGSSSISIYKNQGTANVTSSTYTTEQKYSTGSKANFIETADFDGDGKLDVLVSCESGNSISLYRNTSTVAAIALTSKGNISIPGSPTSIAFADFNKDGKLDILVGVYTSQAVVYTNTSSSSNLSFTGPTTIISSVGGLHDVDAADIDGDGWEDFIVGNNNSPTYILRNIADGSIGTSSSYTITAPSYNLDLGDYNGDGKIDIGLSTFSANTKLYPNNSTVGTISFGTPLTVSNSSGSFGVTFNDLDGDNNIDLIPFNGSNVVAYRNVGSGAFGSLISANSWSGNLFNITSGDLNCDNAPDLVVTNNSNATVRIIPVEQPPCTQPLLVTSTADDSICGTLRYAIGYANANSGADTIDFLITGTAPFVIAPKKPLPAIKDALFINGRVPSMGYTDPTSATKADYNLVIEIDGSAYNVIGDGIVIKASDVTVDGLSIVGFTGAGIYAEAVNNVAIEGNYLGLRANGDKQPNGNGVIFRQIGNASPKFSYIGGGSTKDRNVICANNGDGIQIFNSPGIAIFRNFVGVWKDGGQAVPNNGYGVYIESSDNVSIGINQSGGFGNVISSNKGGQIMVTNTSSGVTIVDNYIGLASDGTTAIASPGNGITINDSKNTIIGSVAFPNKIANNGTSGVFFSGSSSQYNSIISNSIYDNASEGIALEGSGEQEVIQPPVISTGVLNGDGSAAFTLQAPNGTPSIDSISFYADNGTEGQVFLTKVKKTTNNVYSLTAAEMANASVLSGTVYYTTIQTSASQSSSAFSNAISLVLYTPPTQPLGNRGMYFDGVDDQVGAPVISLSDFTIEFWIKTKQTGGTGTYWFQGYGLLDADGATNDYGVSLINGKIVAGLGNNGEDFSITSNASVNDGAWHHVAVTRSGLNMAFYIDGNTDKTGSSSTVSGAVGQIPLTFGGLFANIPTHYFNGQLDEIKIFNIVRTKAQIQADMASTSTSQSNLIHYWNFEDDAGGVNASKVVDRVTLEGAAPTNGPLWSLRVTDNTDKSGTGLGSLRQAIEEANKDTDQDYIDFSIQQTSNTAVSTITTSSELTITNSIFLDGYSAYGSLPNTNALSLGNNAAIRVQVYAPTYNENGINLSNVNNSLIRGLAIYGVPDNGGHKDGVNVAGNNNQIAGCYLGLTANGTPSSNMNNIDLTGNNNTLGYVGTTPAPADFNIVCNSVYQGIEVNGGSSSSAIQGNYIGVGPDGKTAQGNNQLAINNFGDNTSIINNVISGNAYQYVIGGSGSNAIIQGNLMGVGADGTTLVPNGSTAINLTSGSNALIGGYGVGQANIIAGNSGYGIVINGSSTTGHLIKGNNIYGNASGGISLTNGGNNTKVAPVITSATTATISGTCASGDIVEIFDDSPQSGTTDQGRIYLGTAITTGATWSYTGSFAVGDRITATATDAVNGTSEFSPAKVVVIPTPGAALDFDGVNDYVRLPDNDASWNLQPNFTLELWVYPRSLSNQLIIFPGGCNKDNPPFCLFIGNHNTTLGYPESGNFMFTHDAFGTGYLKSNGLAPLNTWSHIAITYDGNTFMMYVNGILQTKQISASNVTTRANIYRFIGADYYGAVAPCAGPNPRFPFNGKLDEFRIWNRALCQAEIQNNVGASKPSNKIGLTAQYSFNTGIADGINSGLTTLVDSVNSSNNGTLAGFNLNGLTSNWVASVVKSDSVSPVLNLPEIDVLGNSVSIVSGDITPVASDSTDFGFAKSVTYKIKNTGNKVLNISGISLVIGTNFTISGAPTTVAIGGSSTFKINFNYVSGAFTDTVKILSDDCDEALYTFVINGNLRGAALDFDGSNDFVSTNLWTSKLNDFTLEASVYWRGSTGQNQEIVYNGNSGANGYGIALQASNSDALSILVGGVAWISSGTVLNKNTWYRIAVVNNNGTWSLYLDGNPTTLSSNTDVPKPISGITKSYIGSNQLGQENFNGTIDEVRIWKRALCQAEIVANISCEKPGSLAGLLARYDFNEGTVGVTNTTVTTAIDSSASGNDGTLNNFTLTGATSNWVAPGGIVSGSTCTPLVLPVGTIWTWTGNSSSDWFSPCNWDKLSIPTSTSDVVVPGATTFAPSITNGTANCKTIKIMTSNGGVVNLNSSGGGVLNVAQ